MKVHVIRTKNNPHLFCETANYKFSVWASNGSCVKEIWNNLKDIVYGCIERVVPRKIFRNIRTMNIKTRKLNDYNQRSENNIIERT